MACKRSGKEVFKPRCWKAHVCKMLHFKFEKFISLKKVLGLFLGCFWEHKPGIRLFAYLFRGHWNCQDICKKAFLVLKICAASGLLRLLLFWFCILLFRASGKIMRVCNNIQKSFILQIKTISKDFNFTWIIQKKSTFLFASKLSKVLWCFYNSALIGNSNSLELELNSKMRLSESLKWKKQSKENFKSSFELSMYVLVGFITRESQQLLICMKPVWCETIISK